jgi:hypothetical protein
MLGLLMGGLQAASGLIQGISGSRQARRAENAMENLKTPTLSADQNINSYYSQANANPYDTALYKQGSRMGLSSIAGLVRNSNDSLLRAGVAAEQQQKQMLANATRMKAMDNQRMFDVNKVAPYQKQFTLLGQKAAGGNARANAGWSNLFGGFQTAAMSGGLNGLFGGGKQQSSGSMYSAPTMDAVDMTAPYASPAGAIPVTGRTFNY